MIKVILALTAILLTVGEAWSRSVSSALSKFAMPEDAAFAACDDCEESMCESSYVYIHNEGTGSDIVSLGATTWTPGCVYRPNDDSCWGLIQCDEGALLDIGEVENLAGGKAYHELARTLKASAASVEIVRKRSAIALLGCGGEVAAMIPVSADALEVIGAIGPEAE